MYNVRPNAVTFCYILSAFNRVEDCHEIWYRTPIQKEVQ